MRGLLALALLVGCSGADIATRPPATDPAAGASAVTEPDPFPFPTGHFAIKRAQRVVDHCGNMEWGSDSITIDPETRTLYSVPDDRLYSIALDRGALVARGTFEPRDDCPNDTYVELWRLDKHGDDRMSGHVTTYSHFESANCLQACKAVFAVQLERAAEED